MILEKFKDLNFCKHISEDGESSLSGTVRRLSITTTSDDFIEHIESSHVRSILVFTDKKSNTFAKRIPTKCKWLKVIDYESTPLFNIPEKLGNLIHLKYLSLGYITAGKIPNSIGMLQNLETLDLKATSVTELPKDTCKLRKLRHLIGSGLSLIQLNNGIGEMTSLQTLHYVNLGMDGAVVVIKELGKLKNMRELGLLNVCREDYNVISSSMNEMHHLEKLHVKLSSTCHDEFIDLNLISPPTKHQKLTLRGRFRSCQSGF
jgi:disease resistance protein RPM1